MTTQSATIGRRDRRTLIVVIICLIVATAPYLNAGKTVLFFDSLILEKTPEALDVSLAFRDLARTAFLPGQELSTLTFAINHRVNSMLGITGFHAPGFVSVNIALHALHVALVYLLLVMLLRVMWPDRTTSPIIPLAITLLYATHPIHVTTLLDVVQRRSILAGLFQTTALLAYLKFRFEGPKHSRRYWAVATMVAFWCCMKSRSTGLAMPLILISLELVMHIADPQRCRRFLKWGTVALGASTIAMLAFMWKVDLFSPSSLSFHSPQTMNTEADWGGGLQALTQARAYPVYWRLLVLPLPHALCIDHSFAPTRNASDLTSWSWACVHLLVISASIYAARRGVRIASFGILLFYATQAPWVFLPHPGQVVEYRLYTAALAPCLILLEIIVRIRNVTVRRSGALICAGAAMALAVITWQRNTIFRSHVRIWQDVATKYPLQFRPEYNLANALFRESRFQEAEAHYLAACRADPSDHRPHYNLANTLLKLSRRDEAAREYIETIRRKPDHAGARQGLAECNAMP